MKQKKIRKVIIPAAGFGTRFLPATKALPKEMLPIVDKPVIQYVVEEAVNSGIEEIIIVTSWQKKVLEDHFDRSPQLEAQLKNAGKLDLLEEIIRLAKMANFIYIRQKGPYGNATPVISASHILDDDEPFAVLWGDEFFDAQPPRLKQMIEVFNEFGKSVISAVQVPKEDVSRYGIAEIKPIRDNIYQILSIHEKPSPEKAPSNLATHGAYILTPRILQILKTLKPGKAGELWLTDAINLLMKEEEIYACDIKNSKYYDTGNKLEYLKANIEFALRRDDLKNSLKSYLNKLDSK